MRTLIGLVILSGMVLAADMIILDGHYSQLLWNDAKYQGDKANRIIHQQFRRLGLK
jgi:hypothetical protein